MSKKPDVNSYGQRELEKTEKQFDAFDAQVKEMSLDRLNQASKEEVEPQTRLSQREIEKSKDIYLKPKRSIGSKEKFNEKFRDEYNYQKEYVHFIAENKEIMGDPITLWTKKFPGTDAEEWVVPVNKPVWGPRYLAERLKDCYYHELRMDESKATSTDGMGTQYGVLVVNTTKSRLDAQPVSDRKSVFMGSKSFG